MKFRKLFMILAIICLLSNSMFVSAENISRVEEISLGQTKVITVPRPEDEIDEGWVYFTQEFTFVPEADGTYRFLVDYEEDPENPYDIFMDVSDIYLELENGIEFDATAGETYTLCFQYPTHDGRYPQFTFYLGTEDAELIPKTDDAGLLLPWALMLLAGAGVLLTATKRNIFQ